MEQERDCYIWHVFHVLDEGTNTHVEHRLFIMKRSRTDPLLLVIGYMFNSMKRPDTRENWTQ